MSKSLKRILMATAGAAVLAGAGTYGWYWYETGRFLESTNDAYVKADYTTIAPKVSGYIADVAVEDNQPVKAGDSSWRRSTTATTAPPSPRPRPMSPAPRPTSAISTPSWPSSSRSSPRPKPPSSPARPRVKFAKDDYDRYQKLTAGKITSVQDVQRAQTRPRSSRTRSCRAIAPP